ncbi:hypothetical protein ACFLU6_08050 [Acidobacteriota bacterium]
MTDSIKRQILFRKLHKAYRVKQFDNTDVWAGNLKVHYGDEERVGDLVRFIHPGPGKKLTIRISAELFVKGVTNNGMTTDDIDARVWADFDDHGYMDQKGCYRDGFGGYYPMKLLTDSSGNAVARGNNAVFMTDEIEIANCGVYGFTAEFSAESTDIDDPARQWLSLNEIAYNKDGIVAVSPEIVATCPSIMEVCIRKYRSSIDHGKFVSGTFNNLTEDLDKLPVEVIYLLPFFQPGIKDLLTGEDVRKGKLGSIYAIRDFYRLDPALCSPIEKADIGKYVSEELINEYDLADLLTGKQQARITRANDLSHFDNGKAIAAFVGRDTLSQLIGRAELRRLVKRAHELGKKVIFDMVIMQTSRDNSLVNEQRAWYQLDEKGHPKKHSIAWLSYSDVALFRLAFNKSLQSYLTSVAAYWIKTCDLDGIRIDAAQTVDRPFLKQLSNRIHAIKPDAIILGETLCPVHEALDVSTDMIYSLMVDHHIRIEHGRPYIDLFEMYHRIFPKNTVAIAYFENHDSARATRIWHDRYNGLNASDKAFRDYWEAVSCDVFDEKGEPPPDLPPYLAALLKNLQASVINASAGTSTGVRFAPCIEMGTEYGEEARTDFENPEPLFHLLAEREPHNLLKESYRDLEKLRKAQSLLHRGKVYYFTQNLADPSDRILCYVRYDESRALFCLFNLDPSKRQQGLFNIDPVLAGRSGPSDHEIVFDSSRRFKGIGGKHPDLTASTLQFKVMPLPSPGSEQPEVRHFMKADLPPLAAIIARVSF